MSFIHGLHHLVVQRRYRWFTRHRNERQEKHPGARRSWRKHLFDWCRMQGGSHCTRLYEFVGRGRYLSHNCLNEHERHLFQIARHFYAVCETSSTSSCKFYGYEWCFLNEITRLILWYSLCFKRIVLGNSGKRLFKIEHFLEELIIYWRTIIFSVQSSLLFFSIVLYYLILRIEKIRRVIHKTFQ